VNVQPSGFGLQLAANGPTTFIADSDLALTHKRAIRGRRFRLFTRWSRISIQHQRDDPGS